MIFQRFFIMALVPAMAGIFLTAAAFARPLTSVKNTTARQENPKGFKSALVLPYAFATESMGVTLGVGGLLKGYGQEQLVLGATAFGSFEKAVGLFLGMWDYRPSWAQRFFLSAEGTAAHYPNQRAYAAPFYKPGTDRPGSNDSNKDDYAEDSGYNNWTDLRLEYVLPLGSARQNALMHYKLKGGMLQSAPVGGKLWNPVKSGVTNLLLRQFNRYESFETDEGNIDATTHPVEFAISYNNTDFPPILHTAAPSTLVSPTILACLSLPIHGPLSNSRPANIFPWASRIGPNSGLLPLISGPATPQTGKITRMRRATSRFRTDRRFTKEQRWVVFTGCEAIPSTGSMIAL